MLSVCISDRPDRSGLRWENISVLCLRRRSGIPVHVLYANQDVTAPKKRETEILAALRSATEAAEAANQARSVFLVRMSHDIRIPRTPSGHEGGLGHAHGQPQSGSQTV